MTKIRVALFLLIANFAPTLHAADPPKVVITGRFVNIAGAPLEITSLTKTTTDLLASVEVSNNTDKKIIAYELGWVATVPSECSAAPVKSFGGVMTSDRTSIEVKGVAKSDAYGLSAADLVTFARNKKAVLIEYQVAIVSAQFDDGSAWNYSGKVGDAPFSATQAQAQGMKCKAGALKPDALKAGSCSAAPESAPNCQSLRCLWKDCRLGL